MVYLPNDLNILRKRLLKTREDFNQAKKRFDYFINLQKSEYYDKFVAERIDIAKSSGKSKEEIEAIKQDGLLEYNKVFDKFRRDKGIELKLREYTKEIKNIKQRMLEIDPNSLDEVVNTTPVIKAQSRFELNI